MCLYSRSGGGAHHRQAVEDVRRRRGVCPRHERVDLDRDPARDLRRRAARRRADRGGRGSLRRAAARARPALGGGASRAVPGGRAGAGRAPAADGIVVRLRADPVHAGRARRARLPVRRVVLHHLARAARAAIDPRAELGAAERWQRRERMYWMLTVLALIIPTVLIAWVNFDSAIEDFLGEMYPGRVALMTTAISTVGMIS